MAGATIKIFLVHADPQRLRTAEISNWTGKAIAGPRSEFDSVINREECKGSGVFFLTGDEPDTGKPAVYIGEAENIKDRVKAHLGKDFWNHIICFVSKDENLTKAHIRYLEGKFIEQANEIGKAIVMNSQGSGSKLPESDREEMETFLEKINQLLPVLGVDLFVPTASTVKIIAEKGMLTCDIKGLSAMGNRTPNGFLIMKGSQAVLVERESSKKYPWPSNMRKKLKADGILSTKSDHLIFLQDTEFSSPSAAAAVVHGGHANGLTAWKNSSGKTLKEIEFV